MTVAELIASREPDWRELEELSRELRRASFRTRAKPETVARFASLYRAVCSDLAVAETMQLPPSTVTRLNQLVVLAHNTLYRRRGARSSSLRDLILLDVPRWILTDVSFWVSFFLFWVTFLVSSWMGSHDPTFAEDVLGKYQIGSLVGMYTPKFDSDFVDRLPMAAFYIFNNGGIGFKTFAFGILGVFPGLFILLSNAAILGASFGYMAGPECPAEAARHFSEFTTAHSPYELTAIVLSAAAGMRMGIGVVMTRGYTRAESLRRATLKATPTIFVAFALFCMAAFLEAFVSPNPMEWLDGTFLDAFTVKRVIFWLATASLLIYFGAFGMISIMRHYRSMTFREASMAFLRNAVDAVPERVELSNSSSTVTELPPSSNT